MRQRNSGPSVDSAWFWDLTSTSMRSLPAVIQDFLCQERSIDCLRKARIRGDLRDHFHEFLLRPTDVQKAMHVHLELRTSGTHCSQRRYRNHFSLDEIDTGSRVNFTKRKFNNEAAEIGRDIVQRFDYPFP